jgi:hypothetical protein
VGGTPTPPTPPTRKGREEKLRKDHIKALDKGDLVFIIFGLFLMFQNPLILAHDLKKIVKLTSVKI